MAYNTYPPNPFPPNSDQMGKGSESNVNYSTNEKVVGTWVDGSKLYEKTYVLRENGEDKFPYDTSTSRFATGDSYGIAIVQNMLAIRNDGTTFECFNYGNSATVLFVDKSLGIFFVIKNNFKTIIVTVRYTKESEG